MNCRPATILTPWRTWKAIGETPRTVTLTSPPLLRGRVATTRISGDARGRPCESRATRESTMMVLALSRDMPDISSAVEPRWVTIAFCGEPVARSADAETVGHRGQDEEHRDDERDAAHGQRGDLPADGDVADVVRQRQRHVRPASASR